MRDTRHTAAAVHERKKYMTLYYILLRTNPRPTLFSIVSRSNR